MNTGIEEITEMAEFISSLSFKNRESEFATPGKKIPLNLLPYHNIASGKYRKLEMIYDSAAMEEPTIDEIQIAIAIFGKYWIEVEIGG